MNKRVLVAYSMSSTYVQTTLDYLMSLSAQQEFSCEYVHCTHGANVSFSFDVYDVVFHSYCARLCFPGYVSESYREQLRRFRGLKILAVQDEYDNTNELKAAIIDLKFDVVLTCVPQEYLEYVYPRNEFPGVKFVTVLTGYVADSPSSIGRVSKSLKDRPIFIGYRGRDIGGRYGRLAFDKYEIGRRMKEECDKRGISTDIAMTEESRIYGEKWFEFVGDCRAMLGSESGSNVFDFDGAVERKFNEMKAANNGAPPSYEEFLPFVKDLDGIIDMGQISPRVFECALMRTPMVLYEGRYSSAIHEDEHFIALKKDFSNLDEVLERLGDIESLEKMADRAYEHLVSSGLFTYSAFTQRLNDLIDEALQVRARDAVALVDETWRQPQASATAEEAAPEEGPTAYPLGMADFNLRITASEGRVAREEAARLEQIFGEAVRHYRSILEGYVADQGSDGPLRAFIEEGFADFESARSAMEGGREAYVRDREQRLLAAEAAGRTGDLHTAAATAQADRDWCLEFSKRYEEVSKRFNAVNDEYKLLVEQMSARELGLMSAGARPSRGLWAAGRGLALRLRAVLRRRPPSS